MTAKGHLPWVTIFYLRLVGFVPGPILFGTVVDSTCLFWQHECGQRGNCWVYDRSTLSTRVIVLATGTILWYVVSGAYEPPKAAHMLLVVFIILCWFVYPCEKATIRNSPEDQRTSYTNMDQNFMETKHLVIQLRVVGIEQWKHKRNETSNYIYMSLSLYQLKNYNKLHVAIHD